MKLLPKNVLADEQLQRELLDRLAFYRECAHPPERLRLTAAAYLAACTAPHHTAASAQPRT